VSSLGDVGRQDRSGEFLRVHVSEQTFTEAGRVLEGLQEMSGVTDRGGWRLAEGSCGEEVGGRNHGVLLA